MALKWTLDDEEAVEAAVALRDRAREEGFELLAPSLWVYEIANGLVVAARRGRIPVERVPEVLSELLTQGVRLVDPDPLATAAVATRRGITAYDAAYVALALAFETEAWSGDRRLERAAGAPVRWIGDFPT